MLIKFYKNIQGQAAVEYLLLLGLVVLIALIGFKTFLPRTQTQANRYFDDATRRLYGDIPADGKAHSSINDPKYP